MPVRVYGEMPQLEDFIRHLNNIPGRHRVIHRILQQISAEIARRSVLKVRKKTRATAQSINFRVYEAQLMAIIGVSNMAGLMLEKGTKAHEIRARGTALMIPVRPGMGTQVAKMGFEVTSPFGRTTGKGGTARLTGKVRGGQIAFYRSVQHPGNQPYPFLLPAFRESLPVLDLLLMKAGAEIVHAMARRGEL